VGTKGRSLDRIGFEMNDLEAYCRKLERMGIAFDRPFTRVPPLNIGTALVTDPWGTSIELTEGLGEVS
jgi:hypothetical protein